MNVKVTKWNGDKSIRVQIRGLFFGGQWRYHPFKAFATYNGKRHSWQLQTWRPKWAHWSIPNRRMLYLPRETKPPLRQRLAAAGSGLLAFVRQELESFFYFECVNEEELF